MSEVDEFLKLSAEVPTSRKEKEVKLWHAWKDSGWHPDHFEPILKIYEPIIKQKVNMYRAPSTDETALMAEGIKILHHTLRNKYNPETGFAISTFVEKPLMKLFRKNNETANASRMSESAAGRIGKVNNARAQLEDEFGRPPTHQEIADHIKTNFNTNFTPKMVAATIRSQRKDLTASSFVGDEGQQYDPGAQGASRLDEVAGLMPDHIQNSDWPPKKHKDLYLKVFYHSTGLDGHEHIESNRQLARTLNISEAKASRIKTDIINKAHSFLFGNKEVLKYTVLSGTST